MPPIKSILHNIGVAIAGMAVAPIGMGIDPLAGIRDFRSLPAAAVGSALLFGGFLLRVWATFHFYRPQMKVISLSPQRTLITSGPCRFSRNPLYLGGNLFIFLGAALRFGSPVAVFLTLAHLPLIDLFIRREEKQLESELGDKWRQYRQRVRRWL